MPRGGTGSSRFFVHELGLTYRPVEETLLDHHESWRTLRRRV